MEKRSKRKGKAGGVKSDRATFTLILVVRGLNRLARPIKIVITGDYGGGNLWGKRNGKAG